MNDNSSALHIVYATDEGYVLPTMVSIASVLLQVPDSKSLVICVLDCGIENVTWNRMEKRILRLGGGRLQLRRELINVGEYANMPMWRGSLGLYARFEIPRILKDQDRCIYADGDTLFFHDPTEMLSYVDDRFLIAGHYDCCADAQRVWHESRGLIWDSAHRVCSGLLVMNLKRMRNESIREKTVRFVKEYADVVYPDQDALNQTCNGNINLLPDGWGKFAAFVKPGEDVGCIHYGWIKPWRINLIGQMPFLPIFDVWYSMFIRRLGIRCFFLFEKRPFLILFYRAKTRVFLFLYMVANFLPRLRGRYDFILRRYEFWK